MMKNNFDQFCKRVMMMMFNKKNTDGKNNHKNEPEHDPQHSLQQQEQKQEQINKMIEEKVSDHDSISIRVGALAYLFANCEDTAERINRKWFSTLHFLNYCYKYNLLCDKELVLAMLLISRLFVKLQEQQEQLEENNKTYDTSGSEEEEEEVEEKQEEQEIDNRSNSYNSNDGLLLQRRKDPNASYMSNLIVSACALASKYLNDEAYDNYSFSIASKVPLPIVNHLELYLLKSLEWRVSITIEESSKVHQLLKQQGDKYNHT